MDFSRGFRQRCSLLVIISMGLFVPLILTDSLLAASRTCSESSGAQGEILSGRDSCFQALPDTKQKKLDFAPDRIIVKLKESPTDSADSFFDNWPVTSPSGDMGELGRLNEQFQVTGIDPFFQGFVGNEKKRTSRGERKKQLADLHQQSRVKHAKRAARASHTSTIPDLSGIYILSVPKGTDILAACKSYAANPNVEYATPSFVMEPQSVPNDPYFSTIGSWGNSYDDMWALKKIQADLAWDTAQGEGIVVAVVDTGLDYNHIDIAANVWTNTGEIPNNGLDDDGNGFVDDLRGWHFDYLEYPAMGPLSESEVMDTDGHGTLVAGIIGAVGNNGIGMIGVAPKSRIMPVKIHRNDGFNLSDAYAKGILYADLNGADVINLSWGCSECTNSAGNPLVADVINSAIASGAVVVTSADNWRADVRNAFPANIQDVITVSATDENDDHAQYSNTGFKVDVAAPGGGGSYGADSILSLFSSFSTYGPMVGTGYKRGGGTSTSAAFVSGVAALVLSANPTLTQEQVVSIIRHSADDLKGNPLLDIPGYDRYFGWGRVNAKNAVSMALLSPPPADPPILKVPSDGFSFKMPQNLCGGQEWAFAFDVYNVGGGSLNWNVVTPPWITPVIASGTDFSSSVQRINTAQSVEGALLVSSNGYGVNTAQVPVSVSVMPDIKLSNCSMALTTAAGNQTWDQARNPNPPAIPDGMGGAYYVWYGYAYQSNYKVMIQHVDSTGTPLWSANGLRVSSSDSFQYSPAIISDGAGGAIVLWVDGLNTGNYADKNLAMQRISSTGQLLWGGAGIAVTRAGWVAEPVITDDGSGGAIVAWTLLKSNDDDVYAQRISASGALLWGKDGAPVSAAATYEFLPKVAPDGNGGAFFTWEDRRYPYGEIFAQHLDKNGLPLWQQNGILMSSQQGIGATGANVVADGVGGAIIAWFDSRNRPMGGNSQFDIYAARIDAAGQQLWGAGGVPVATGSFAVRMHKVDMISDKLQGAVVSWIDARNVYTILNGKKEIFAQRLNGAGDPVWTPDGVPVLSSHGWGMAPSQVADGDGGVLFAYEDSRFDNFDIYLQHLKADGSLRWGANGIWMHSSSKDQTDPYLVQLGGNRLAITWNDQSGIGTSQGIDILGEVLQLCTDHDGDGSYAEGGVCGPIKSTDPVLAVNRTGTGQGSIESFPSGINCGADCNRSYAMGTSVTLKAVAAPNSYFSGWTGGGCSGTGECTVHLVDSPTVSIPATIVEANFTAGLPVRIAENSTSIYPSPQDAYNNAFSGNTIISKAQTFNENLNLNLPVSVNLVGGYDGDFASKPDYTQINGTVTVSQGSVTVDSIIIH